MAENRTTARAGHEQTGPGEAPQGLASSRIRSMRDLANLNLRVGLGVLGGRIGTREATCATGSFREVRRTVVEGQRIGYEKQVLDDSPPDPDHLRELELTAELEALRERRGA